MSELTQRVSRVQLDTASSLPKSLTVETWQSNALDIEAGIFSGPSVLDITDITSVNCKVRRSQLHADILMDSTVAAAAMDATLDASTWADGSKQHATFSFTNAETNLPLVDTKATYWIVFTAIMTSGEEVTLAAGEFIIHEDNNTAGDPPPENLGTAITIEEGDARYEASGGAIDGGRADSIYTIEQVVDGGGA